MILANYCIRLEVEGQPGCYDKGLTPFTDVMADMWDVGGTANLVRDRLRPAPGVRHELVHLRDDDANLPVWPQHILDDITPGATLSSNFARLRHTWFTLWWTHFDPTLLVSGGPLTQSDEYFTRSLLWSNNDDWLFDGANPASVHPTYSIFTAYEVHGPQRREAEQPVRVGVTKLGRPSSTPAPRTTSAPATSRRDQFRGAEPSAEPRVGEQRQLPGPFEPQDAARRPTFQLLVANIYRVFFWKLIARFSKTTGCATPTSSSSGSPAPSSS